MARNNQHATGQVIEVILRREPEGHWSASSGQAPGLHIEGDTAAEAEAEAREWAPQLLVDNGVLQPGEPVTLTFTIPRALAS